MYTMCDKELCSEPKDTKVIVFNVLCIVINRFPKASWDTTKHKTICLKTEKSLRRCKQNN